MIKVIIKGYREGMQKVSLTKLQVELLKTSLKQAKSNVDSVLDDREIIFEIENESLAITFMEKVNQLGVNCTVER
jgi:hypothetical protein